jgi:histone-lysine N-methyltransferase SETMAR
LKSDSNVNYVSTALLQRNETRSFLDRIITCDKKWILYDGTKCGISSSYVTRGERRHAAKIMVTVWWTSQGVIHHSYLKPGQTMTANLYCEEIKKNA